MTTGDRIKAARKAAGLTQKELADKIGVKFSVIHKYETGMVVNLKRETIAALAKALDVKPSWLMCMDEEIKKEPILEEGDRLTEDEQHFLTEFRKLSVGAQESVNQILQIVNKFPEDQQPVVSSLALTVLKTKGLL